MRKRQEKESDPEPGGGEDGREEKPQRDAAVVQELVHEVQGHDEREDRGDRRKVEQVAAEDADTGEDLQVGIRGGREKVPGLPERVRREPAQDDPQGEDEQVRDQDDVDDGEGDQHVRLLYGLALVHPWTRSPSPSMARARFRPSLDSLALAIHGYAKKVDGTSFSTREIMVLLIRSISSAVSPDPNATFSRQFGVRMSDGEWASELMTRAAPASRASDTTLPFPSPCEKRAEISRCTPLAAARRTSSSEMMPGVGEDVDPRLDAGPVGSQGDRLAHRLAVEEHQARAELPRPPHQAADLPRAERA